MRLQQRLYYGAHVRVGCVNFVYHQQAARQAGGAHVRVANLKRRHHRLIHRADRYLRRQIPLGALRRPAPSVVESVFPPHPIIWQMPPVEVARADISRNRQDGERRGVAVRHHAFHEFRDPAVNLNGGGARGQGEVERIHALALVKTRETPQRRLRLAGAGFGFDYGEALIKRNIARRFLHRVRREVPNVVEDTRRIRKAGGHRGDGCPLIPYIQAYLSQRLSSVGAGGILEVEVVQLVRLGAVWEALPVRPYPVGESA